MRSETKPGWKDEGSGDEVAEGLAHAVIGAAIEVHRELGPGLPESAYEAALAHELSLRGLQCERQAPVAIVYKGVPVGDGRIDLFVERRLVVELKACEALNDLHRAQVRAYLCVTGLRLGLLINFNVAVLHDGIRRVLNGRRG
jgi:GxxExxY protein